MMLSSSQENEQFERIPTVVHPDADAACEDLASEIATLIRENETAGRMTVLGFATGSTPVRLYRRLVRMHREDGLSFASVIGFNLDEYYGLEGSHPESYRRFMQEQLFGQVDIAPENVHVPDGTVDRHEVYAYCRDYEQRIRDAGGIDLQILGIGRTGHIGFNEPGSGPESRTRLVTLDSLTRRDAARDFLGESNVPRHAITMGVGTILEARRIVLLAWGEAKAEVIRKAVEQLPTPALPASFLQGHPGIRFLVDRAAASDLTRFKHPWRTGPVEWSPRLQRQAVIWLSRRTERPILKLVDEAYAENELSELITEHGPAYNLNIRIFNEIQHTITGWPGGKPGTDDTNRPERAEPARKRVLVLSPEPSDAESAMGGTLHRLVDQEHEVTLAHLTSGNLAVPDALAGMACDLVLEMSGPAASASEAGEVRERLDRKALYELDGPEIRRLKGLVRRWEAKAAADVCGLQADSVRFLDCPFYEKGRYRQFSPDEADVARIEDLLREIRPHQIYVTGNLADPSSVAAVCFSVFLRAVRRVAAEAWWQDCRTWLYREGCRAWPLHEIDMAVPLSPAETANKLEAIYRHQSLRSQTPAFEAIRTEAWQQIQHLNRDTATAYDALGLAEYDAIETFRRWEPEQSL